MSHAAHIASTSFLMHQMLVPRMAKKSAEKKEKAFAAGESLESGAVRPVSDERHSNGRNADSSDTDDSDADDSDAGDHDSARRRSDESHAIDLTI